MSKDVNKFRDRIPRQKTPEQALASLMRYCSRAERSSGDALRLMRGWKIADSDAAAILERLRKDRFIDDSRFARAYVRDKSDFAGWGPRKIMTGLRGKGVAPDVAAAALDALDRGGSQEKLKKLLERKSAGLKGTIYERKGKLLRFGLSRGFDYETVAALCEELMKNDE